MKPTPRVSEAEWEVMKVIWRKAPCVAPEVIAELTPRNRWHPATVKTLLNRLIAKGALRFEKKGRAYVYSAAVTENELKCVEADSFLDRVFDGGLSPMIAHFVQSRSLTAKEREELASILRVGKKKP